MTTTTPSRETHLQPEIYAHIEGDFAYTVRTVNDWRIVGETTVWGSSAAEVADTAIAVGFRKVEVAPAAPVNGYANWPHIPGDTAARTR